jgi:hypothetical protein
VPGQDWLQQLPTPFTPHTPLWQDALLVHAPPAGMPPPVEVPVVAAVAPVVEPLEPLVPVVEPLEPLVPVPPVVPIVPPVVLLVVELELPQAVAQRRLIPINPTRPPRIRNSPCLRAPQGPRRRQMRGSSSSGGYRE